MLVLATFLYDTPRAQKKEKTGDLHAKCQRSSQNKKRETKKMKETFYQTLTRRPREIQVATGDDDFDRQAHRACDTL